jgi:hypothetical protein
MGGEDTRGGRRPRAWRGIAVAIVVVVVAGASVAVAFAVSGSPSSQPRHSRALGAGAAADAHIPSAASPGSAEKFVVAASLPELKRLSASLGYPIYWAGPKERAVYELTVTADGRVYIRYLVGGAKVGSPSSDFLTIGTYRVPDPVADLGRAARSPGSVVLRLLHGAIGYYNRAKPTSVYFADPGSQEEVETYDPSASVARALVESRAVKPVP